MKKLLSLTLTFAFILLAGTCAQADDILRAKHTLGKNGVLWEWDHIKDNWSMYISAPTDSFDCLIAAGPAFVVKDILFNPLFAVDLDATRPNLAVAQIWIELYNEKMLGEKLKLSLDNILAIDSGGDHNITLIAREYLLYAMPKLNSKIGPQTELFIPQEGDAATDFGIRWEYNFNEKTKLVNYFAVTAQSPQAKKVCFELWHTF